MTQTLTSGLEHRIGNSRCQRRQTGLTHAFGMFLTRDNMHIHCRRLGHAQHRVIMEITLLHHTLFKRDLAVQSCREAIDDAALYRIADNPGVDHRTAINRSGDSVHNNLVAFNRDLGNLRHSRAK